MCRETLGLIDRKELKRWGIYYNIHVVRLLDISFASSIIRLEPSNPESTIFPALNYGKRL
jgi:hypothetical protein